VIDSFTTVVPVIGTDITFEGLPFLKNLVYRRQKPREYVDIIHGFPEVTCSKKQQNASAFRLTYDTDRLVEQL
jgi:hypothetical protein